MSQSPSFELEEIQRRFQQGELEHEQLRALLVPVVEAATMNPYRRGSFGKARRAVAIALAAALRDMEAVHEACGEHYPEVYALALRHTDQIINDGPGKGRSG